MIDGFFTPNLFDIMLMIWMITKIIEEKLI